MPKTMPLSVAQIVGMHGIPKRTVIAAIDRGDLRADKMPGRTGAYLIDQRELDKWLAKRAERTEATA